MKDVASFAALHRKFASKTTVYSSLQFATTSLPLVWLMNLSRFTARNPDVKAMFATAPNEAFHTQFKAFFRNVFHESGRNANSQRHDQTRPDGQPVGMTRARPKQELLQRQTTSRHGTVVFATEQLRLAFFVAPMHLLL